MHENDTVHKSSRNFIMVLGVIFVAILAFAIYHIALHRPTSSAGLVPTSLHLPSAFVAPPPGGVGCYYQKPSDDKWRSVACVPPSVAAKLPRPQVDAQMFAASAGSPIAATSLASSLREGYTSAWFSTFSGEADSSFGPNTFSIQNNTNFFQGNNGQTDWVQFVYTYAPPGSLEPPTLCVWSIDITTDFGQTKCLYTPIQTLSSTFGADVYGATSMGWDCKLSFLKWHYGCRPVRNLTATLVTAGGSWAVTDFDYYGLSSSWDQISGTILGAALQSVAQFTSPTLIGSNTGEYAPGLNGALFVNQGAPSAETNNLNFLSEFDFCNGNGWCYLVTRIGN